MLNNYTLNTKEISIPLSAENVSVNGFLTVPKNAEFIVIFAHGSGSDRFSPRNQAVAKFFLEKGLATLIMDMLTQHEEDIDMKTKEYRFDIPLLAKRMVGITDWIQQNPETQKLKVGYFGSSTGAAAALIAASNKDSKVYGVVSRGGRPELANENLPGVMAPTLIIVGANDFGVLELNQEAFKALQCEKKLEIIPGAAHRFEEPGKLEEVAVLAASWFEKCNRIMRFRDRYHAGDLLVERLRKYQEDPNTVVLGLPRGGVIPASVIAKTLGLPLDFLSVRKVGAPGRPDLSIGSVNAAGETILDQELINELGVPGEYVRTTVQKETENAKKRLEMYRQIRPEVSLQGKNVIIVDDGIANGATMKIAIQTVKSAGAARIIVAVPIASPDSLEEIVDTVNETVWLEAPLFFVRVHQFYDDFSDSNEEEVMNLLRQAAK